MLLLYVRLCGNLGPQKYNSGVRVGLIGMRVGSAMLFGYQHVGISNTKWSRWGSKPMQRPDASGFALQWNIGFMSTEICLQITRGATLEMIVMACNRKFYLLNILLVIL